MRTDEDEIEEDEIEICEACEKPLGDSGFCENEECEAYNGD